MSKQEETRPAEPGASDVLEVVRAWKSKRGQMMAEINTELHRLSAREAELRALLEELAPGTRVVVDPGRKPVARKPAPARAVVAPVAQKKGYQHRASTPWVTEELATYRTDGQRIMAHGKPSAWAALTCILADAPEHTLTVHEIRSALRTMKLSTGLGFYSLSDAAATKAGGSKRAGWIHQVSGKATRNPRWTWTPKAQAALPLARRIIAAWLTYKEAQRQKRGSR